jgi:hypothetical protein
VRAESVDQFVLERLAELTREPHLLDERIRAAGCEAFGERDKLREERARLEREIAKNLCDRETLLSRLVDSSVATSFMEEKLAGIATIVAQMQERVAESSRRTAIWTV